MKINTRTTNVYWYRSERIYFGRHIHLFLFLIFCVIPRESSSKGARRARARLRSRIETNLSSTIMRGYRTLISIMNVASVWVKIKITKFKQRDWNEQMLILNRFLILILTTIYYIDIVQYSKRLLHPLHSIRIIFTKYTVCWSSLKSKTQLILFARICRKAEAGFVTTIRWQNMSSNYNYKSIWPVQRDNSYFASHNKQKMIWLKWFLSFYKPSTFLTEKRLPFGEGKMGWSD